MGDQVGIGVGGFLYLVPYKEFKRIRSLPINPIDKTALFADCCRINTLYMIARAGSGHIGSSFSSLDIMCWLELNELSIQVTGEGGGFRDLFFSSKGHDAPGLYSVWIGLGKLEFDLIHRLRRIKGLPGHPDISTPNVVTNTGSLGMGVSKAKGIIFADRLEKKKRNVYVLTGDGELQEGQFWESLISAANHKLHEMIVIIDYNKMQSDTLVSKTSHLGDLPAKLRAFGWHVMRCDGHDLHAFSRTVEKIKQCNDKPKVIIADTIKGKGVSFMEHTAIDSDVELYKFHSGAPNKNCYEKAAQELIKKVNKKLTVAKTDILTPQIVKRPISVQPQPLLKLIECYSEELVKLAKKNKKIIALDADLILDTGLIPFRKNFPDRFFECGIAEQDMVSQAGALALRGFIPIVHSFTCFLSSRANEQIFNNATEKTKVIYVGSLAGILPATPGHSHQGIRDIAALRGIPGLTIVEPSNQAELRFLLNWAVNINKKSTYIRLVSFPVEEINQQYLNTKIRKKNKKNRNSADAAIITHGPLLLPEINKAVNLLWENKKIKFQIVNMLYLNSINKKWLLSFSKTKKFILIIENHICDAGIGEALKASLCELPKKNPLKIASLAIKSFAPCGTKEETLKKCKLNADFIYKKIISEYKK